MRLLFSLFASGLLPLLFANTVILSSALHTRDLAFDALAFRRQVVTCPAVNRALNQTIDIHLRYVDINPSSKRTLLLLHGWPSLWASWKYQIQEFKSDYRLIVPDIRGFGASTHPGDVQSSGSFPDLVGDLMCILRQAGVTQAVVIGHDWGSQLAYEAARERPDVFTAVVGISIPYLPSAGPPVPISSLVQEFPRLAYQVYFAEHTSAAIAELSVDIRRSLRATLRTVSSPPPAEFLQSNSSYLAGWGNVTTIPPIPFLSAGEEDYWVGQYSIQNFSYNLEFYTNGNRLESYTFANGQGNATVPQPVLSILPTQDPVADWVLAAEALGSANFLPNLTQVTLPGAHWVQLEFPRRVNTVIRNFLSTL
ncbi:Alpha/Beta hydrolase protein [Lactarius pseudohatsudake]|nr:Alpha/Beta hydrolase protein [Lactarius pseudohatsudake]